MQAPPEEKAESERAASSQNPAHFEVRS